MPSNNAYMTAKEAAEKLGRTHNTILKWCRDKTITAYQPVPNGDWLIDRYAFYQQFPACSNIHNLDKSA